MPVVRPIGGHAVYIDARALLPHIPPLAYPGQALAVALYEAGGIRGCEIGTVMFGRHPDGTETPAAMDLVRLGHPPPDVHPEPHRLRHRGRPGRSRRGANLRGYRIVNEPPALRHFTATFAPPSRVRAGAGRLGAGVGYPRPAPDPISRLGSPRPERYELVRTLSPLRHGHGDPTIRLETGRVRRATRTPDGPATIEVVDAGRELVVRAWGPGAGWAVERAADLCGLNDDPAALLALDPPHRIVVELARRFAGVRIPRTNRVVEALVPRSSSRRSPARRPAGSTGRSSVPTANPPRVRSGSGSSRPPPGSRPSPTTPTTRSGSSGGGPRRSAGSAPWPTG